MIDQDTRKNYFENLLSIKPNNHSTKSTASNKKILRSQWINTKLGLMLSIADDKYLYLLDFINSLKLEQKIKRLANQTKAIITFGFSILHRSIQHELDLYFQGNLSRFTIPIFHTGSEFQKRIWEFLIKIPSGITHSYIELASNLNIANAVRAVANANGSNKIAIIVPCHRIVGSNNKLGGYSGGIENKRFLLEHERSITKFG